MKKIAVILVLLVYGFTNLGATINLHYCMDEFVGWSVSDKKDNACDKCGMKEKKGGCCKEEHKQVKVKADQQQSIIATYLQLPSTPALTSHYFSTAFGAPLLQHHIFAYPAPPRVHKQRLYLLNSVFII